MNNSKSTEAEFLAAKRIVQAKARKEYEDFLDSYKRIGADERFEKMVEDSGKISFFRSVFIQVSILGRLDPWKWAYLKRAYKDKAIIADFYEASKKVGGDASDFFFEQEENPPTGEGADIDFIYHYVDMETEEAKEERK